MPHTRRDFTGALNADLANASVVRHGGQGLYGANGTSTVQRLFVVPKDGSKLAAGAARPGACRDPQRTDVAHHGLAGQVGSAAARTDGSLKGIHSPGCRKAQQGGCHNRRAS